MLPIPAWMLGNSDLYSRISTFSDVLPPKMKQIKFVKNLWTFLVSGGLDWCIISVGIIIHILLMVQQILVRTLIYCRHKYAWMFNPINKLKDKLRIVIQEHIHLF